jgi:hypothetical protein
LVSAWDSDVLVMHGTPGYFEGRWTSAKFGRALAKSIRVLRIGWRDSTPSVQTDAASRAELFSIFAQSHGLHARRPSG